MNADALGMVETKGLMDTIKAAGATIKATNVSLVGYEKIGSKFVTVMIGGDVDAVKAAIGTSAAPAATVGEIISTRATPRPHTDVEKALPHLE